jgi:hypothetical protein
MEPEAREQEIWEAELLAAPPVAPLASPAPAPELRGADGGALRAEEVP